ncbi:MAG: sulfotransferase family protein [Chthoniobacterales bacterium]
MVMGVQRSGTTTLFNSLARDPGLISFHESVENPIFDRYRLRPLAQIAPLLDTTSGPVLLKPISETFNRTLEEIAAEYAAYNLRFVWIYRDPVNVLHSMHRQGWLSRAQIGAAIHLQEWERRNRLALRFQQLHPDRIAIVRYEDLCLDAGVFRQLSAWLSVNGTSLFRSDGRDGRKSVSCTTQQEIDATAGSILGALDDARTFRARTWKRWNQTVRTLLSRNRASEENLFPRKALFSAPSCLPSTVPGLQFWLDVSACEPDAHGKVANFRESGPRRLLAGCDTHRPHQKLINGRDALFFAAEKVALRQSDGTGILRFGAGEDWSFMFGGSPVSIFVVYKPQILRAEDGRQHAVIFRVGPRQQAAPSFSLEWDRCWTTPRGVLLSNRSTSEFAAEIPFGSHTHQQWGITYLQTGSTPEPSAASADCELQLGGTPRACQALFSGSLAELLIFQGALSPNDKLGVLRYLQEKHRL